MGRKRMSKQSIKDLLKSVLILIIGAGLSTASFLVYYLVEPNKWIWLSVLFVLDYAFAAISAYIALFGVMYNGIIKSVFAPAVYIAVFVAVPTLCGTLYGAFGMIANNIVAFVVYAFSTVPCILVIVAVVGIISYIIYIITELAKPPSHSDFV